MLRKTMLAGVATAMLAAPSGAAIYDLQVTLETNSGAPVVGEDVGLEIIGETSQLIVATDDTGVADFSNVSLNGEGPWDADITLWDNGESTCEQYVHEFILSLDTTYELVIDPKQNALEDPYICDWQKMCPRIARVVPDGEHITVTTDHYETPHCNSD